MQQQIQNYQGRNNTKQDKETKVVLLCMQKTVHNRDEQTSISQNHEQLRSHTRTGDERRIMCAADITVKLVTQDEFIELIDRTAKDFKMTRDQVITIMVEDWIMKVYKRFESGERAPKQ